MLSQQQQREAELVGVDESTAALLRNRNALQDQRAALDAASAAAQALASTNASISQQINSVRESMMTQEQLRAKKLADASDESTKALLRQLFAEEDKADAIKKQQEAEAQAAQAAQQAAQAAQQAAQAAQQLVNAWQSVGDSIMNEIARIRGLVNGGSAQSLASMQADFAIAAAAAKAGDIDAAKRLSGLSQSILSAAEKQSSSLAELNVLRSQIAMSLTDVASVSAAKYGLKVPGFAGGGDFGGGIRLVGENGPELEATGASRIFNANQTAKMLSGGGSETAAELRMLREEISQFRGDSRAQNLQLILNSDVVAKVLRRVETPDGLLITDTLPELKPNLM